MTVQDLVQIGLNETQAKAYIWLVKNGSATPPSVSKKLGITRTNAYAVLDQLTDLGLAKKDPEQSKLVYRAENPIALEGLARKQRQQAMEYEESIRNAMPSLLNYFHSFSDQPGIKFFQGTAGIKEIYQDTLRSTQDIYVIRSLHDQDLMSVDFYDKYKQKRAKLGIKTYMINPSTDTSVWNQSTDSQLKIERTSIRKTDYTSQVEVSSYGNKTALISFGEEAIGMIIESPQIADAMKQIFQLVRIAADRRDA